MFDFYFLIIISNSHILSRIIVTGINTIGARRASIPAPNAAAANLSDSQERRPGFYNKDLKPNPDKSK